MIVSIKSYFLSHKGRRPNVRRPNGRAPKRPAPKRPCAQTAAPKRRRPNGGAQTAAPKRPAPLQELFQDYNKPTIDGITGDRFSHQLLLGQGRKLVNQSNVAWRPLFGASAGQLWPAQTHDRRAISASQKWPALHEKAWQPQFATSRHTGQWRLSPLKWWKQSPPYQSTYESGKLQAPKARSCDCRRQEAPSD